jgi:hypothetical protein
MNNKNCDISFHKKIIKGNYITETIYYARYLNSKGYFSTSPEFYNEDEVKKWVAINIIEK